jgi:AraC-like DNA-binding protein
VLTHRSVVPDSRLRRLVHSYVERESCLAPGTELAEPVVARLSTILEFQFADAYDVPIYGLERPNPSKPITVIGPITWRRAQILIRGHVQALAIVFQPLGFHALFGVPVSPLADEGVEGHALLGNSLCSLYERLGNAQSFQQRTGFLNEFLVRRLSNLRHVSAAALGLERLISSGTQLRIADIARQAGLSERQFERIALQHAGMSPLMMRRIARFQRALRLKIASGRSWTDIAYSADYYDQMHMVREFRAFAGEAPGTALRQLSANHISRLVL